MQGLIPLYTAEGELQDWISEQRMAHLDDLGLIRIVRHKKGRVSRCILPPRPGAATPHPVVRLPRHSLQLFGASGLWPVGLDIANAASDKRAQLAHVGTER